MRARSRQQAPTRTIDLDNPSQIPGSSRMSMPQTSRGFVGGVTALSVSSTVHAALHDLKGELAPRSVARLAVPLARRAPADAAIGGRSYHEPRASM